jgi:hypothetical protein
MVPTRWLEFDKLSRVAEFPVLELWLPDPEAPMGVFEREEHGELVVEPEPEEPPTE